jgi:hypothetical protein
MPATSNSTNARIRLPATRQPERGGGETRPYEYPHLYQIQAGDWRISYAVEKNRLAILVLEVLNSDGTVAEDPVHETLTRKMKVKLLDWPEGSPSRDVRPEDLGRKLKIRLLDLTDENSSTQSDDSARSSRIRLEGSVTKKRRPSVILDAPSQESRPAPDSTMAAGDAGKQSRKVTPVDSPSM